MSVIGQRIVCLAAFIILYRAFGLRGLGYAYLFLGGLHIVLMSIIMKTKYNIQFNKRVIIQLLLVISVILLSRLVRGIGNIYWRYLIGVSLILSTLIYSYYYMKKYMGIDIIRSFIIRVKSKLNK